jgi:hypothetical protein
MKSTTITALIALAAMPAVMFAEPVAEVVSESPDGAVYERDGSTPITAGDTLMGGDLLVTNDATVVLAFADGSVMTVSPKSSLKINEKMDGSMELVLNFGEVLGKVPAGVESTVITKIGTTMASNGVFGVLQSQTADETWTLQVRNLNGSVSFLPSQAIDPGMTVSLLEPGKLIEIAPGEEIIVRGLYNEEEEVFVFAEGEAPVVAVLDNETTFALEQSSEQMASVELPSFAEGTSTAVTATGTEGPGQGPGEGPSAGPVEGGDSTVIIEIPFGDIEVASDKG